MNKLSGKVAIVTGSSQGIGKAIALELLRSGALVTLNARNKEKLGQTLRLELRPRGVHIGLVMVGLTDFDEDKPKSRRRPAKKRSPCSAARS